MNKTEEIKQNIIRDYSEYAELAMIGIKDTMNLRQISVDNFILKVDELIKEVAINSLEVPYSNTD